MYQSGIDNGVRWSVELLGGRTFLIKVGDMEKQYQASYPLDFGLDLYDNNKIIEILDGMINLVGEGGNT